MARGREAVNAILRRPVRVVVVVTHGNLMILILQSFQPQFGFQVWEHLSNPDVYCLEVEAERVRVTRTWVPPVASSGTSQGASATLKGEEAYGWQHVGGWESTPLPRPSPNKPVESPALAGLANTKLVAEN